MAPIAPQAESFLLTGSDDTACLFIHGFTASPSEMYPVAQMVHAETNYTVSGPLLPGHGSSPQEMNQTGWEDWFERVEQEIAYLQQRAKRIYVTGLSLGGLLSLHAASHNDSINGVIAINTPIFSKSPHLMALVPLLSYVKPFHPKRTELEGQELEKRGRFAYPVYPLKALQSMRLLRANVIKELPDLKTPLLLFQSQWDENVDPRSAKFIKDQAQQAPVKLIELQNSSHIATMGPDNQLIAQGIIDFIKHVTQGEAKRKV